ncbi:MAG: hypothetical protein ACFFAN_02080 [Promethearchaeota archaeon]
MKKESIKITEIESELFALVNSITNLYKKYQEGLINDNLFQKAIKNAMNGLFKINFYLKEKKLSLSNIVKSMNFIKEYNKAIKVIKDVSALNSSNQFSETNNGNRSQFEKKMKSNILELPALASKITSSFITLMDALKLGGQNSELIIKLLKNLKNNFKNFFLPGLEEIEFKINKIYNQVLNNASNLIDDKKFRETLVDKLYQVFKEFQLKLDLKT